MNHTYVAHFSGCKCTYEVSDCASGCFAFRTLNLKNIIHGVVVVYTKSE